jgi:hypothetical protein
MEPESSLQYSQQPATGPYPEPDEFIPHLCTLFTKDSLWYYPPILPRSSELPIPFRFADRNSVCLHLSHACFMPRLSYLPWFRTSVQVMKPLIFQSSPDSPLQCGPDGYPFCSTDPVQVTGTLRLEWTFLPKDNETVINLHTFVFVNSFSWYLLSSQNLRMYSPYHNSKCVTWFR